MINKICFVLIYLLYFTPVSCYSSNHFLDGDYQIEITGFYSDTEDAWCKDFRLTVKQVEDFFKRAEVVDQRQIHDEYMWMQCYVTGILKTKQGSYTWEIRLVGIGKLTTPEGEVIWLGCKDCDEMF